MSYLDQEYGSWNWMSRVNDSREKETSISERRVHSNFHPSTPSAQTFCRSSKIKWVQNLAPSPNLEGTVLLTRDGIILPYGEISLICNFVHIFLRNPHIALHLSHCELPGAVSEQAVIGIELSSTIGLGSGPTRLHSGWIMLNTWKVWIWYVGWWWGGENLGGASWAAINCEHSNGVLRASHGLSRKDSLGGLGSW